MNEHKKFLGRKYDRKTFDCWIFVKDYLDSVGISITENFKHRQTLAKHELLSYRNWIEIKTAKKNDLVLFQDKNGRVDHCGVMLDGLNFVHCCVDYGVLLSQVIDGWRCKFVGYYRLKNDLY